MVREPGDALCTQRLFGLARRDGRLRHKVRLWHLLQHILRHNLLYWTCQWKVVRRCGEALNFITLSVGDIDVHLLHFVDLNIFRGEHIAFITDQIKTKVVEKLTDLIDCGIITSSPGDVQRILIHLVNSLLKRLKACYRVFARHNDWLR